MTASRTQHVVAATIILVVGAVVAWLSFTQEPAEAFLFPRLVAVFFVLFATWNFVRAATGLAKIGEGLRATTSLNILPGLAVALFYVFVAAEWLGFYTSSTLAFLIIFTLYDPVPVTDARGWVRRIYVTVLFMAVIYGLFTLLLKVQTPRGLLF